jgi:hypothetical protein
MIVSQWMTKTFKTTTSTLFQCALLISFFVSCNPTEITSSGQRAGTSYANGELANMAFIYRDSPYILEGPNYGPNADMKGSVDFNIPEFITNKSSLKGDCTLQLFSGVVTIQDCIHSYDSKSPSQQLLPRKADGTWIFTPNSSEFYQVNALYHIQQGVNTFFDKLSFAYNELHAPTSSMASKAKSIPKYLPNTGLFWFQAITPANDNYFRNSFLSSYALCNLENNARFSAASPELCFGKSSQYQSFFFIQDPSIVYHELGHALIAIMMNFRNGRAQTLAPSTYHPLRSNLGSYGYDEAGSLGEGIADYYSFVMNKRTHFAEWALGKFQASRPISEEDPSHITGISATAEGRLSYPQFLLYDSNHPTIPVEDIHLSGQITSHYLVALTKSLQTECSMPVAEAHNISTSYVMMLVAETFSELGDLNAVGVDASSGSALNPTTFPYRMNNLDENASFTWAHIINPPTYRKFFQVFAKNLNRYVTGKLCPSFTQDESEKLLDDYGLLLFKTYNDNGSTTKSKTVQFNLNSPGQTTTGVAPKPVLENNRRKSVLVSKELLDLAPVDTEKDVATYYIIDDQESMSAIVQNLLFKGTPVPITKNVASVEYNNSNIKVSPGEVIAIIPNLFNNSNSTMGGIHLLASDWDHTHIEDTDTGNFKPCVIDNVTTVAQGAEAGQTCTSTMTSYKRNIKNASTGEFSTEAAAPVCLVQIEDGDVTRWVSQNEFRRKQGLTLNDKDCLGYGGTGAFDDFTFNPHECLVRVLPGSSSAYFSKIDPQKSYVETVRTGNPDHTFSPTNAILFEVNKWIPPGTKFRCRMRAKFSNCSDCFNDPNDATKDDYIDSEYNGAKPFKIINVEFDVND